MRFVLAIVSFVLSAALMGYGIAQRTILASPDEVAISAVVDTDAAVTVIDGATLNAFDGSQTLSVHGSGDVFAAYGRTADVLAWIGDTEYNAVSLERGEEGDTLVSTVVPGTETEVPNPNGSDLWLDDYVKDRDLTLTVNVPEGISFIIVSDGVEPAPADISLSWPLDNSTPWSGPLIVGGAIVLLLGLGFLVWAVNHMRSTRGPRRKPQKMPKVPKPGRKTIDKPRNRRAVGRGMIAVPVVLVGALALSGCSADYWPDLGPGTAATPSPSATAAPEDSLIDPPAVTVRQVERIVARIGAVAEEADAAKNKELIATRFDGAALEDRLANYAIQTADPSVVGLPAIEGKVGLTLPQQTDTWPRTVLTVLENSDKTVPPIALMLVQEDPRSDYKVSYSITLEPAVKFPDVAPASVGASRLGADVGVLKMSPAEVALAYGDILELDVESDAYLDFEAEGDTLRTFVGLAVKQQMAAALPTTARIEFSHQIGPADAIALATNDAGAIVAVNLYETTTVVPVEAGAAVNPSGQVKALSGLAISTKGVVATYGDQLLFYVPPAGSDQKIILLGYSQGLVKATEVG